MAATTGTGVTFAFFAASREAYHQVNIALLEPTSKIDLVNEQKRLPKPHRARTSNSPDSD